jgi:RNA polymerase sigma-70 factor (ECF subfamily)
MKGLGGARHLQVLAAIETVADLGAVRPEPGEPAPSAALDVRTIYEQNADFVWLTLQRFGVLERDLDDMAQEVFVVVHRRLGSFEPRARMTTWLYGICLRVASGYRRKKRNRPEDPTEPMPELDAGEAGPDAIVARREAQGIVSRLLDAMDLEKRAVFVMFEIDELSCDEIALIVGVPVGTVYSRLHAARAAFQAALRRHAASVKGGAR